jgi:hypothetical protein
MSLLLTFKDPKLEGRSKFMALHSGLSILHGLFINSLSASTQPEISSEPQLMFLHSKSLCRFWFDDIFLGIELQFVLASLLGGISTEKNIQEIY